MILMTAVLVTPPDVAVTVAVEGPFGVDMFADVQPTIVAVAIASRISARYAGRTRGIASLPRSVAIMSSRPANAAAMDHGCTGIHGTSRRGAGGTNAVVAIINVVLPFRVPANIFAGFMVHFAPVRLAGNTQVKFTSAGNGAFAGVVVRLMTTLADMPPVIPTVPAVA